MLAAAVLLAGSACGDLQPIRAPGPVIGCASTLPGTLALYRFDARAEDGSGGLFPDDRGHYPAHEVGGRVAQVDGPPGCGRAIDFPSIAASAPPHDPRVAQETPLAPYLRIAHAPAWDLPAGAIDFWFLPRACPGYEMGVLTRDAQFTRTAGHLRVLFRPDCRVAVRTQRAGDNEAGDDGIELATSAPLQAGRWAHIGINFGAPALELWLDGARSGFAPSSHGIDGNQNPWTLGVSNDASADDSDLPVRLPLQEAALDHLRIGGVRVEFSRGR